METYTKKQLEDAFTAMNTNFEKNDNSPKWLTRSKFNAKQVVERLLSFVK